MEFEPLKSFKLLLLAKVATESVARRYYSANGAERPFCQFSLANAAGFFIGLGGSVPRTYLI